MTNQDATRAGGVLHCALGPGRSHDANRPLPPLDGLSVAFVGAPPAHVLLSALAEARAVAVVATHEADLVPKRVLWASGPTLEEAARCATGWRK